MIVIPCVLKIGRKSTLEPGRSTIWIKGILRLYSASITCYLSNRLKVIKRVKVVRGRISLTTSKELLGHGATRVSCFASELITPDELIYTRRRTACNLDNLGASPKRIKRQLAIIPRPGMIYPYQSRVGISSLSIRPIAGDVVVIIECWRSAYSCVYRYLVVSIFGIAGTVGDLYRNVVVSCAQSCIAGKRL